MDSPISPRIFSPSKRRGGGSAGRGGGSNNRTSYKSTGTIGSDLGSSTTADTIERAVDLTADETKPLTTSTETAVAAKRAGLAGITRSDIETLKRLRTSGDFAGAERLRRELLTRKQGTEQTLAMRSDMWKSAQTRLVEGLDARKKVQDALNKRLEDFVAQLQNKKMSDVSIEEQAKAFDEGVGPEAQFQLYNLVRAPAAIIKTHGAGTANLYMMLQDNVDRLLTIFSILYPTTCPSGIPFWQYVNEEAQLGFNLLPSNLTPDLKLYEGMPAGVKLYTGIDYDHILTIIYMALMLINYSAYQMAQGLFKLNYGEDDYSQFYGNLMDETVRLEVGIRKIPYIVNKIHKARDWDVYQDESLTTLLHSLTLFLSQILKGPKQFYLNLKNTVLKRNIYIYYFGLLYNFRSMITISVVYIRAANIYKEFSPGGGFWIRYQKLLRLFYRILYSVDGSVPLTELDSHGTIILLNFLTWIDKLTLDHTNSRIVEKQALDNVQPVIPFLDVVNEVSNTKTIVEFDNLIAKIEQLPVKLSSGIDELSTNISSTFQFMSGV